MSEIGMETFFDIALLHIIHMSQFQSQVQNKSNGHAHQNAYYILVFNFLKFCLKGKSSLDQVLKWV